MLGSMFCYARPWQSTLKWQVIYHHRDTFEKVLFVNGAQLNFTVQLTILFVFAVLIETIFIGKWFSGIMSNFVLLYKIGTLFSGGGQLTSFL